METVLVSDRKEMTLVNWAHLKPLGPMWMKKYDIIFIYIHTHKRRRKKKKKLDRDSW